MSAVLEEAQYQGTITIEDQSIPLSFMAEAGGDCRILIRASGLTSSAYVALAKTSGQPGAKHTHFSIYGATESGQTLKSDDAYLGNHGSGADGHFAEIAANEVTVEHGLQEAAPQALRLWLRGFRSFRNAPVETPLGVLAVAGPARVENDDEPSGVVQIVEGKDGNIGDWYERSSALLRHMRCGLALAHGGRLQVPLLEHVHDQKVTATFHAGSAFAAEFAVQHSLNQDPIIRALANRFFEKGALSDAIWTAVGWMHIDTTFDEVRYLTAMTALELLTESELSESKGTVIPKASFKPIRETIHKDIETAAIEPAAKAVFQARISDLNRRTFADRIGALFERFNISSEDFEGDVILRLVQLRNAIVHTGEIPEDIDIWPSIILVRELITRIVLSEIGFQGRYLCYIGGQHDREFKAASQGS